MSVTVLQAIGVGSVLPLLAIFAVGWRGGYVTLAAESFLFGETPEGRALRVAPLTLSVEGFGEYQGPPALFEVKEPQGSVMPNPRVVIYGTQRETDYVSIELTLTPEFVPNGEVEYPLRNPARERHVSQISLGHSGQDFYSTAGRVTLNFGEGHRLTGNFEAQLIALSGGQAGMQVRGTFSGRWVVECQVAAGMAADQSSPGSSVDPAFQWQPDQELMSPFCSRFRKRFSAN
jgi:hypothetical protein